MISDPPSGTVTFLFTDIEGSTKLAQEYPEAWETARTRHHAILKEAIESNHGYIFHIIGDAFCAAFHTAGEAVRAGVRSQIDLDRENWGELPVKVRIGVHTGKAEITDGGDYQGYLTLSRVQRLMSSGHGGQVLLSLAAQELVRDELPEDVTFRDMGERRLKDLIHPEHIYQLIIANLPANFPPLKTLDAYRHNLPTQMTSFIGREKEIEKIKQALTAHRLVTLTGSGGTGKTRLSLQVAAEMLDAFSDGVWFVELAPLVDPYLIPQTLLASLNVPEQKDRPALETLKEYLRPKNTLIVLDNCEHLIAAASQVANTMLNAASKLKILASSREALGIPGELTWHVPSLNLPDPRRLPSIDQLTQYESVHLFVDRASLVDQHFDLTEENAYSIAQICYRLDGIPLALELAAARVKVLAVDQISSRLDDRFRLLTGGARTALPRQQTLRATIDWSYDLLSEHERLMLRRLAVFMDGWTLELAERICANNSIPADEVLELLGKLVDKSLVMVEQEKSGLRYRILETVRQYAREKLFESGEGEAIRDKHMEALLAFAETAEPKIRGAGQLKWLDRVEAEYGNLRAALEWSRERNAEICLSLAGALWRFWDLRGYTTEAKDWFTRALELTAGSRTVTRARTLSRAGEFYRNMVETKRSLELAEEASALARELNDKTSLALALATQGEAAIMDEPQRAQGLLEEALSICKELGNPWLACTVWYSLARLAERQNLEDMRLSYIERGLQEARLSKDNRRISRGLADLSFLYLDRGEFAQAERALSEGLALARQIGDKVVIAERQLNLAWAKAFLEEYAGVEPLLLEARTVFEELGENFYEILAILWLGLMAWARNDIPRFTELVGTAVKAAAHYAESTPVHAFTANFQGICALLNRDFELAKDKLTEALAQYQKANLKWNYSLSLISFGMLAVAQEQMERAAKIFGAYEKLAPSLPAELPFLVHKMHEQAQVARTQLGTEAYGKAAAEGKGLSLEQALAYALETE